MTAEKLHDAISLLPADLVAEADKVRCGKPKRIYWKRYAAMAACFAVVLSCGLFAARFLTPKGSTETALEAPAAAAPMEAPKRDMSAAEEAGPEQNRVTGSGSPAEAAEPEAQGLVCRRVETPMNATAACFSSNSVVKLITSAGELEAYFADKGWIYDFTDMTEACRDYDAMWFANHDLLIMAVHAAYVDFPYTVTAIENSGGTDPMGWDWFVLYTTAGENHPEGDITVFHLLTELKKGLISPEDSILPVADPVD